MLVSVEIDIIEFDSCWLFLSTLHLENRIESPVLFFDYELEILCQLYTQISMIRLLFVLSRICNASTPSTLIEALWQSSRCI